MLRSENEGIELISSGKRKNFKVFEDKIENI